MMCRARVVLPLDSGPKISTMRPRGTPPTPSARSSARAPVGIEATFWGSSSPMRMIEPFPNCRSIWDTAASMALLLSNASLQKETVRTVINIGIYRDGLYCRGCALPRAHFRFFNLLSGRRLEGEVAGEDLTVLAELPEVLAVDLDPDGPGVPGLDADRALRVEGLREAGLGDLLVGQPSVRHDAQPGRVALHAHHDRERLRLRRGGRAVLVCVLGSVLGSSGGGGRAARLRVASGVLPRGRPRLGVLARALGVHVLGIEADVVQGTDDGGQQEQGDKQVQDLGRGDSAPLFPVQLAGVDQGPVELARLRQRAVGDAALAPGPPAVPELAGEVLPIEAEVV